MVVRIVARADGVDVVALEHQNVLEHLDQRHSAPVVRARLAAVHALELHAPPVHQHRVARPVRRHGEAAAVGRDGIVVRLAGLPVADARPVELVRILDVGVAGRAEAPRLKAARHVDVEPAGVVESLSLCVSPATLSRPSSLEFPTLEHRWSGLCSFHALLPLLRPEMSPRGHFRSQCYWQ